MKHGKFRISTQTQTRRVEIFLREGQMLTEQRRRLSLSVASFGFSALVYLLLLPDSPKCAVPDRITPSLDLPHENAQLNLDVVNSILLEDVDTGPRLATSFLTSDRVAVLVEPRAGSLLLPTIDNFASHLPLDWRLQLFLSEESGTHVRNAHFIREMISMGRISIETDDLLLKRTHDSVLRDQKFWNSIHGEHVLLFRTGSVLCRWSAHSIEEFLSFDFVGAGSNSADKRCGRGGLNLRSRTKMLEALARAKDDDQFPGSGEDFVCSAFPRLGARMADKNTSLKFAVEGTFADGPLGMYGVHKHFAKRAEELHKLYVHCPEALATTTGPEMCSTELTDPLFERHLNLTEICEGFR